MNCVQVGLDSRHCQLSISSNRSRAENQLFCNESSFRFLYEEINSVQYCCCQLTRRSHRIASDLKWRIDSRLRKFLSTKQYPAYGCPSTRVDIYVFEFHYKYETKPVLNCTILHSSLRKIPEIQNSDTNRMETYFFLNHLIAWQEMNFFHNLEDFESEKPVRYREFGKCKLYIYLLERNCRQKCHRCFHRQYFLVFHVSFDPKWIHLFHVYSSHLQFDMLTIQRPIRNRMGIFLPEYYIHWNRKETNNNN